jgi:hypothetical protein
MLRVSNVSGLECDSDTAVGVSRFAIDKGSAIVAVTFSNAFSVTVIAAPQV